MKKPSPLTFLLAAIVLSTVLHFLLPLQQLLKFPWRLVSILPLLTGIALNLSADQIFKRYNTTVKPFEKSNALITSGVFRITRNPMYLGMTLILLGIALLMGSITPYLVVIAFPILVDHWFISPEEKLLENTFGDQFRQYQRQIRKWI
ncbi:MAG: isoprenylcysteine carboxylmethyltransferase family protein [Lentisphaerae bacterium]|nr:isoprenylcysteine carboxylmethyltransferase family protein [Lentisphaerota bacterium]